MIEMCCIRPALLPSSTLQLSSPNTSPHHSRPILPLPLPGKAGERWGEIKGRFPRPPLHV